MNYNKLNELQAKRNLSNRELARELGISDSGYKKMIENQTITVKVLERLADFYNVDISIFFQEKSLRPYAENNKVEFVADNGHKCLICAEKEKQIKLLEKHVDLLERTVGKQVPKA